MDKILEALKKLVPAEEFAEVSKAVEDMLAEAKTELHNEFDEKLKEAYAEYSKEVSEAEATAEKGYKQAYAIIEDLTNRLELQKEEFERKLEEGYEEAYELIKKEQNKNESFENNLHEEFDNKLNEFKEFMVNKVDAYLEFVGDMMLDQAKKEVLNDPTQVEHKIALDKIIDIAADYLSDDDYSAVTSSKLDEATRVISDLRSQVKLLERKNLKLTNVNSELNEAVREKQQVITESTQEKNERTKKAENASGRGIRKNAEDGLNVIKEWSNTPAKSKDVDLISEEDQHMIADMQRLAGLIKEDA